MNEILRMAFGALGVNKLRSFLTMSGITIGVFSVIGVMTAVSALRGSIETGLSFLGSNMFQFAKWPTGIRERHGLHKYAPAAKSRSPGAALRVAHEGDFGRDLPQGI
jgi:putative ABC transport system permease protein